MAAAPQQGGFNFDLCKRNEFLEARGAKHPGFTKTGTTIAGVIFKARRDGLGGCPVPNTAPPASPRRAPC